MKYKLFIWICLLWVLAACNDDDRIGFDVPVEFRKPLEFVPAPGGAIMRYHLKGDDGVFGVRVRYTNAWGEQQVKDGSYLSDSLILGGFTDARQNVPGKLSFFNRQMEETEPIDIAFDTEKSATVAVFDDLEVNSFWGGFNVTYTAPEAVSGIIHVFYVGDKSVDP